MKAIVLLLTASLIFFSLGLQAFSGEPTPASEASPPSPNPESGVESPRSLIPDPLPRLSDAEIEALQAEVAQNIDLWFDLAGVSAMVPPPAITDELEEYREAWSAVDLDVTTFLGSWVYLDSAGSFYSVTVFPSRTPGQACVLEFIPESSLYIYNEATGEYVKDILAEQLLTVSVATVQDGHLRSSQVRSVGSATVMANYVESHSVAFMGLMDNQGTRRVVALASPPALPSDLPAALVGPVSQTLNTYGCIINPVLPGE